MDIINCRRSVRNFINRPVEPEKIELLLRAAMQAPSARNQQPWHFVVIEDKETLRAIATTSRYVDMINECACVIAVLIDKDNLKAPLMAPQDAAAATQNVLLRAVDLNLGACWCGMYPRPERMIPVMKILNIPDRYDVFSLIALGYPAAADSNRFIDRYDEKKIHFEKY